MKNTNVIDYLNGLTQAGEITNHNNLVAINCQHLILDMRTGVAVGVFNVGKVNDSFIDYCRSFTSHNPNIVIIEGVTKTDKMPGVLAVIRGSWYLVDNIDIYQQICSSLGEELRTHSHLDTEINADLASFMNGAKDFDIENYTNRIKVLMSQADIADRQRRYGTIPKQSAENLSLKHKTEYKGTDMLTLESIQAHAVALPTIEDSEGEIRFALFSTEDYMFIGHYTTQANLANKSIFDGLINFTKRHPHLVVFATPTKYTTTPAVFSITNGELGGFYQPALNKMLDEDTIAVGDKLHFFGLNRAVREQFINILSETCAPRVIYDDTFQYVSSAALRRAADSVLAAAQRAAYDTNYRGGQQAVNGFASMPGMYPQQFMR